MDRPWHGLLGAVRFDGLECSVDVQCSAVFCTVCSFTAPTGHTKGIAGPKLAGYTCTTAICELFWLAYLWGAGCTRQDQTIVFERGPPVLGNIELATPNLVR